MTVCTNEVVEPFDTSNKKLLSTVMLQESIAADRSIGGQSAAAKPRRPHRQKIPPEPFLSVRQLAEAGGVSIKTVYWWLAAQKIPAGQVKRWRSILVIHKDDAKRFLTAIEPLPVECDAVGGGE